MDSINKNQLIKLVTENSELGNHDKEVVISLINSLEINSTNENKRTTNEIVDMLFNLGDSSEIDPRPKSFWENWINE